MGSNWETLERLDDQIDWYGTNSTKAQWWYKGLRICSIAMAALIPFAAGFDLNRLVSLGFDVNAFVAGGLGVAIVIIEAILHVGQYQHNWLAYRSTCEGLKREQHLHAARAGHYAGVDEPDRLLAERIELLISTEHAGWVAAQKEAQKKPTPKSGGANQNNP